MSRAAPQKIEIMDTTLRDGEQTPDVAYTPAEKLQLAQLLLTQVKVDRIEIASTRVSKGEREAARLVTNWARRHRQLPRVEMLGYCDGRASVDWIVATGPTSKACTRKAEARNGSGRITRSMRSSIHCSRARVRT